MDNLFTFLHEEELLDEFPDNTPITDEEIIAIVEKVDDLFNQSLNNLQSVLEAKGAHLKGRPGLAVHPQGVKGSSHQKPYTRHQWEKSLTDVNKSKHAATMFKKAEKLGGKGKSGEEIGNVLTKHSTTVTKGKKSIGLDKIAENHKVLNTLLDKRPDVRESMLKQLDKFHEAGKADAAKGDTAWLDASERAIAMVGGDLAPHHGDNASVKKRLDELARFKNVKTAVVHNAIMNKLLESHGVPKEYFNDPAGWEAKNGELSDHLSVPHPGENVNPKVPAHAKPKASSEKPKAEDHIAKGIDKALDVIASFMDGKGKHMSKEELLNKIKGKNKKSETFTPKGELKQKVATHALEKSSLETKVSDLEKHNEVLQKQLDASNKIIQQNTEMMTNMNKMLAHLTNTVQVSPQQQAPSTPEDVTAKDKVAKRQSQKKKTDAVAQDAQAKEQAKEIEQKKKEKDDAKAKEIEQKKKEEDDAKAKEEKTAKESEKKAIKDQVKKTKEHKLAKEKVQQKYTPASDTLGNAAPDTEAGAVSPEKVKTALSLKREEKNKPEDFASMLTSLGKYSSYAEKLADGSLDQKYVISHKFEGKDGVTRELKYLNTAKIGEDTGGDATQVMSFNEDKMEFEGKHTDTKGPKTLTKNFPVVINNGSKQMVGYTNGSIAKADVIMAAKGDTFEFAGLTSNLGVKKQKEITKKTVASALLPMRDENGVHMGKGISIKLAEQGKKANIESAQTHNVAQSAKELESAGLSHKDATHMSQLGFFTKEGMESGLHLYLDKNGALPHELTLKKGESIDLSAPENAETRKRIEQVAKDAHKKTIDTVKRLKDFAGEVSASWVGANPYVIHKEYNQFMNYKVGEHGNTPEAQNPNSSVDAGKIGHKKRSLVMEAQQYYGLHEHLQEMLKTNTATPRLSTNDYMMKGADAWGKKGSTDSMKSLEHEQYAEIKPQFEKATKTINAERAAKDAEKKKQQEAGKKELEGLKWTGESDPVISIGKENPAHAAIKKKAEGAPKKEESKVNLLDKLTKEPHEGASKEEKAFYDGNLNFDNSEAVNPVEASMGGVAYKKGGAAGNTYKVKVEGDGFGYTKPISEDNMSFAVNQGPRRPHQMDEGAFRQAEREVLTADIGKVLGTVGEDNLVPPTVMKSEGNGWSKGKASVQKEVAGFKDMIELATPAVDAAVKKVKETADQKGTTGDALNKKLLEARFKARGDAMGKALGSVSHEELGKAIAFDEITGATDRNLSNFGVDGKGKLKFIDNGLNFGKDPSMNGMDLGSVLHSAKEMRGKVGMAIGSSGYTGMYKTALEHHDTIIALAKAQGLPQAEVDALSSRIHDQGAKFKAMKPNHEFSAAPEAGKEIKTAKATSWD